MDWKRIEDGLASDGRWVGWTELADVRIVLRRDTSVGSPIVHLFPGYLRKWPPIGKGLA